MPVALKIDLVSLAAARDALPPLLRLLEEYRLKASFFPALGPDPDARRGLFRRPPRIAEAAREPLLQIREAGHELGLMSFDVAEWRREVLERDADWTRDRLRRAVDAFRGLFGEAPRASAAADFLVNADTPLVEAELGLDYAVDTRGVSPYLPVTAAGRSRCPQLPVTLPRIGELLAAGQPLEEVHQLVFMETQKPLLPGHLFSYTAGDPDSLPVLEKLLVMWMGSQRKVVTVRELYAELQPDRLPAHQAGLLKAGRGEALFAAQGERAEA